tara:strand:+ start:363 stop:833 length:471 start_codon:yes stop_codon:yes gene_type:complete
MNNLNEEQFAIIADREAYFLEYMDFAFEMLLDFSSKLESVHPEHFIEHPLDYIVAVDDQFGGIINSDIDDNHLVPQIGFFLGSCLNADLDGQWLLNKDPNSKYFARYVVGNFKKVTLPNIVVDPMQAAFEFFSSPIESRSGLMQFYNEIVETCKRR